ncbi:MAG: ABC transporter permease [Oscillospiraceae bacterium]|nr:ABC transporter permease [Oscillospiraceae bacterium]
MEEKVIANTVDRRKQMVRLFKDNNSVLILILILAAAFIVVDGFGNGFYNVMNYTAMYGPVCLGLAIVMITGNIDLSAGFQAGLAGVTSVICFNAVYRASGSAVAALIVAILGAVITGAITGFINGFFVAKIGVSSLIATIAANYAYQGVVFYFAQSSFSPDDADAIKLIARTKLGGMRWLTPSLLIFLAIVAVVFLWMYKSKFGNNIYIVGDNAEAASYAGISVRNTVWVTYVICGVLSAICGFFMVSSAGYAIYTQGNSLSTLTISCCVIGGIKMAGGKGTAIHVLLGVLIMRVISQMMSAMFLAQSYVNLITGALLIVVLIIDRLTSNKATD